MRILSTVGKAYYGHAGSIEPMYLAFTHPLELRGHRVDHFDHSQLLNEAGPVECGERFVRAVRGGGYDLVLYQTAGRDHMVRDAISEAKKYAPIVAWNSDDDWQWESYSRHIAPYFTYMVTTYPHVYEQQRVAHPNLLLSQWGVLDLYADYARKKDIDFSFAGQVYRTRVPELRQLWRKAGLKVYGLGSIRVWCPPFNNRSFRETAAKVFPRLNSAMQLKEVNAIWNRTKISYTPMSASVDSNILQIKGRAFEMGLSGTMMLCQNSPGLDRYYEPGREFVAFDGVADCIAKAKYYLKHDRERQEIANAYYRRTAGEHTWDQRWKKLFRAMGLRETRAKAA